MSYKHEYDRWLKRHIAKRNGDRKDVLRKGLTFSNNLFIEQIWWKLMGHFDDLHPEYEVNDWRGRSYYVDFMWIINGNHIVFEIMDYGSHGRDRTKYRQDLNRALFLQSQSFQYIEISLDELKENPTFILSMLRSILAPYLALTTNQIDKSQRKYGHIERQLMRLAILQQRRIRPTKAAQILELHQHTIIKYCRILVSKGKFRALQSGKSRRVYQYEYIGSLQSPDLI